MGTTAHGLPYPEPTDPVADGATAIEALAEAITPSWIGLGTILPPNAFQSTAPPSSYPAGASQMAIGGAGSDWFGGLAEMISTFATGDGVRAWQVFVTASGDGIHMRAGISGGWGAWSNNVLTVT